MMQLYEGQLKDYNWNITSKRNHHKGRKGKSYCNNVICFDTESTSAWIENGKVIGYTPGIADEYWNSLEPISLCYIWMCAVEDDVYYAREIKDFLLLLKDLPSEAEVVIWVHNLSYDFCSALINILTFDDVFARSPHKPIYARCAEFPNITFKCSYTLTGLSLASWGKVIGVKKLTGDLDYSKLYTPISYLDDKALGYCEADVRVMVAGIRKYIERFENLKNIPMTKTGIVRKKTKDILCCPYYVKLIKKLVPATAEMYHLLMDVFAAGYTHANRWYSGQLITLEEVVYIGHKDYASSYPTWTICAKVPCTQWILTGTDLPDPKTFEDEAYILKLELWDIECTTFNTYLQGSKCSEISGAVWDNGRIIKAKHLVYICTELDYDILLRSYKIGKIKSRATYQSHKDYLPDDFREYILQLYEDKTRWKGVKGYEDIYMNAKADINAASFGMMVTSIMSADVIFENNQWYTQPLTKEAVTEKLKDLRKYNPRDTRYFLSYSWGIWVCTSARHALWECILSLDTPAGKNNVLYCDTDSIFYTGYQDFSWYNDMIDEKLRIACEEGGLDFNKTRPLDPQGIEHPLGHFEEEDETIIEFKTLGAKRYCTRLAEDNKLHITIAGINKGAAACLNDNIDNFTDGFKFDKDDENVHKLLHTYTDAQPVVVFPDGYEMHQQYGINMRPVGYKLEINDEYKKLIDFLDTSVEELDERAFIDMRGKFEI